MRFSIITLFLCFFISLSNAALIEDFTFTASESVSVSSPRNIPFYLNDNITIIGEAAVVCNGGGEADVTVNVTIDISIQVQVSYSLTDVYVWLGPAASFPNTTSANWNGTLPSNGVTKAFHDLIGNTLNLQFSLEEYESLLTGPKGVVSECLRVAIVIDVKRFCGSHVDTEIISYSPPGCDISYEALYPAAHSYFQVAIHEADRPGRAGNHSVSFEGWCVKPTVYISANTPYAGQLYSTYDPVVLNSEPGEFVEYPQNLPLINYLINHETYYTSPYLSGYQCNWQDIQNAIWTLVYPTTIALSPALLLPNASAECLEWIVNDVLAHGRNYTPHCPGGKYLMLIYPIIEGCDHMTCMHDNDTQIIVIVQGGTCLNNCKLRHCHHRGICGGAPQHTGCHPHRVSSGPVLEELIVFDVCLEAKCLPPSPSPCPSYSSIPSASNTPCPSSTNTASYSSVPSASNTPCPSTTNTASYSSVPSASSTPCPSTTNTASYSSVPSASNTPCVSTTNTASYSSVPSQSGTPCPSESSRPSHTSSQTSRPVIIPTETHTARPTESHTPYPSHSPCPSESSHPSHTPYPSHSPCPSESSHPSRSSHPSESHTPFPSHSPCSPPPSHTSYPSHSPCPSESSHPSESSFPSQSHTPHPSYSPCPPPESHTPYPSHSSCPRESHTSFPSHSPCPSHSTHPSESHTSHPSFAPSQSHTPHPSYSPCHASESHTPFPSHSPCDDMRSASPSPSMCADGPSGGNPGQGNEGGHGHHGRGEVSETAPVA